MKHTLKFPAVIVPWILTIGIFLLGGCNPGTGRDFYQIKIYSTSQEEHWNAFRSSPEWNRMKALETYQNTVSHVDRILLFPTEYSDF